MDPHLKYKASLDAQNLKELRKEEIVIFASQINSIIDIPSIDGYIFAKFMGKNNIIPCKFLLL